MTALLNEETLKQDLGKFPSTFDFDSTSLTKDRVKSTIRKLEDDRKNTRKLDTEDIQISNFLSYLYFVLGNYEHADVYIEESLQKDPENIIANTNKARFLLETGNFSDVEDMITKLQKLERREDYYKRKCYAEADLAYAYARSGPWYHQKAVDLYTRVLEAYPTEYAWQYGLGLALFRQTHRFISQADDKLNPRENEKTTIHAAELFLTVATKSDDPNLRANAYARLGKAVFSILKNNYTNVPDEIMRLKPKEYFEKAVEICPEEPSVLESYGQVARYIGELDTSEKVLRKSLQIKPTCHVYHHLALTLKRRVENSRSYAHNKSAYNFSLGANGNRRGGRYKSGYGQKGRQSFQGRYGPHGSSRKRDSQNGNWRQKGSSREFMSDQSDRTRINLRQMMKSPLNVRVYPGNKHLSEAIELLEKAGELSEYALNIQYDKGIICRMLGQNEKAVKIFKNIVTKKKNYPTKFLMTNVYEQLGLCQMELSKSVGISPDIQQKYKKDGQANLSYAVQLQSETVANDPQFKEAWNSYPTLKELFSDERDGKPRQLAVLHMLMGDHRDSIDIYRKLSLNDKMRPEDCVNMLKCYQKEGQFVECVILLSSWECTTFFSVIPPSLIFDVYVDCAFHAYTTDNAQLAYQHFRRAFRVYGMFDKINEDAIDVDEDEATKDILILHSCSHDSECKLPRNLGTMLEDVTGLRCTINSDDVLPNKLVLTSVASFIQKIPCIIIMTHESADSTSVDQLFVDQAIQRSSEQSGPKVLVVSDDKRNMPDIARTKPFIRIPPPLEGAMDPNEQIPEEHQDWLKEFITLLKPK